ncbi:MAG TPA: hypothetical protein PLY91_07705 [Methanoregulaceae archaeon]|nr:hypothetical protein [Methanoregulaceae archaeon]
MIACPCSPCTAWAVGEAGSAGDPWRSVLAEVLRWAELRVRGRDEDLYDLMKAEVEQRNAADLLRAAGWCP